MVNRIKKIFMLVLLTILLIGIVNATENTTHNTDTNTNTIEDIQESATTSTETIPEPIINKEIRKQSMENRTTKKATKTIMVTDFETLHNTLTGNKYNTLTLNIKSNIILSGNTEVNNEISKVTINGNGKTINGIKKYQFLNIPSATTIYIKNIKIINCNADYGGSISNSGKLTITNSNINNNKASISGGAIYNNARLTIKNSTLHTNKAKYGGSILSYEKLEITNSKIYSSIAEEGGAIDNEETTTIKNTYINNNKAKNGGAIYNSGTLTITGSKFNNNKASKLGGAITENNYETNKNIKVYAKFTNNTAPRGGAIFINSKAKNIRINSNFTKNHANFGGAIYNNFTNNVIIIGNFNYNHASNDYYLVKDKGNNTKLICTPLKFKYGRNGGSIYNMQGKNLSINIKSAQKIKHPKLKTKIHFTTVPNIYINEYVTIKGNFSDEYGNELINTQIILKINDKTFNTKTNNMGTFTYDYKTNKGGTNVITASYVGNENYNRTSLQKTFTVYTYSLMTLPIKKDQSYYRKYIGNDLFESWYATYYGSDGPGICVRVTDRYSLDTIPVHKIVKAKFYLKNNRGKVITRTVTDGNLIIYSMDSVSGYTPYKVDVTYGKLTTFERENYYLLTYKPY